MVKAKSLFDAVVGFFETIVFVVTAACIIILAALVCAEIIMRNLGRSIIIFFLYIAEKGWGIAMRQMKIPLTQSRLPRGLIFWGLPVGTAFSIFFMLADLVETFVFGNTASLTTQEEKQVAEIEAGRAGAEQMAREILGEGGR